MAEATVGAAAVMPPMMAALAPSTRPSIRCGRTRRSSPAFMPITPAAPIPCSPRPRASTSRLGARTQMAEARVNTAMPVR